MKNNAFVCELTPARRKKVLLGPLAFLVIATGAVLALDREAGAVPGAPALPNLNIANLSLWAAPTPQVVAPRSFAPLQHNLYNIVSQPGLIGFPNGDALSRGGGSSGGGGGGTPLWNGQGALPNAFEEPWHFAQSNFDPMFKTSYWNERDGFKDNRSAPWRQGMAGRFGFGAAIFSGGMAYVGKPDFSGLLPVANPPSHPGNHRAVTTSGSAMVL